MGFLLFDKSGTFSPATLGLSPGDIITAIVVGGGGGGGAANINSSSYATAPGVEPFAGGNGGPSSFGSYATALGGGGGICAYSIAKAILARSYQGGALGGLGEYSGDVVVAGGGAGGWLPDMFEDVRAGGNAIKVYSSTAVSDLITVGASRGAGAPGNILGYTGNYTVKLDLMISPEVSYLYDVLTQYYGDTNRIHFEAVAALASGVRGGAAGLHTDGINDIACGRGGRGYGAGGGSVSGNTESPGRTGTEAVPISVGGNAGEIKVVSVTLQNLDAIPVTVGGGGSGAAAASTARRSSSYSGTVAYNYGNGKAGTAGAGGAALAMTVDNVSTDSSVLTTYGMTSGRGGYGDNMAGDAQQTQSSGEYCACGGGGAGGCVAVFW